MNHLKIILFSAIILFSVHLSGCVVGTVVGAATDVAVEVVKVPFKVGGAVVDVVSNDDKEKEKK